MYEKKKINNSAWHLLILSINFNKLNSNKNKLIEFFLKKKISLQVHYIPIYKFKVFKKNNILNYNFFPGAEEYFKNSVSLPIFYKMTKNQIKFVVNTLTKFIKKNENYKKKH